jgi:anti-sigma regulatory factor (Ser/Thr protein kinase)
MQGQHHWPHVSILELAALPTAVPRGRLHAKQVLWEWQLSHLANDAELLVSEALSNAVRASWQSGDTIALRLLANRERLLIEVWDHNPADPEPRQADDESESGRGLTVIQAIANRWGYQHVSATLKVVWAELLTKAGLYEGRPGG